jgi:hypothetical protein
MKVLAIRLQNRNQGEFVVGALHDAAEAKRFVLDDFVLVSRDASGKPELHKHRSWFHRHALPGPLLERIAEQIDPGEAAVVAQGDEKTVDAVGARVRAIGKGDYKTYDVVDGTLHEVTGGETAVVQLDDSDEFLRDAADAIPQANTLLVKMPFS